MSLSTLLEAAKYLDYLDSSQHQNQQHQQQQQRQEQHDHPNQQQTQQQNDPKNVQNLHGQFDEQIDQFYYLHDSEYEQPGLTRKRSIRRGRGSAAVNVNKRNAVSGMLAMSLPSSAGFVHDSPSPAGIGSSPMSRMQRAMPIPMVSSSSLASSDLPCSSAAQKRDHSGLSRSYTTTSATGSPLSSPCSTGALLTSSKTSGITSNVSSAASSLSSSDSVSSCGDILMCEADNHHQYAASLGSSSYMMMNDSKPLIIKGSCRNNTNIVTNNNNNNNNNNNRGTGRTAIKSQAIRQASGNISHIDGMIMIQDSNTSPKNCTIDKISDKRHQQVHKLTHQYQTKISTSKNYNIAYDSPKMSVGAFVTHHQRTNSQSTRVGENQSSNQNVLTLTVHPSSGIGGLSGSSAPIDVSVSPLDSRAGRVYQVATSPQLYMTQVQGMPIPNSFGGDHKSGQTSIRMAYEQSPPASSSAPSSYSRHRELHKTLEKNRRAHLRNCFELLNAELPGYDCVDRKTSHINIIKSAIRCVLSLREHESILELELRQQLEIKSKLTDELAKLNFNVNNINGNNDRDQDNEQDTKHVVNNDDNRGTKPEENVHMGEQQKLKQEVGDNLGYQGDDDGQDKKLKSDERGNNIDNEREQQLPVAEQQLSFLLSRSKID